MFVTTYFVEDDHGRPLGLNSTLWLAGRAPQPDPDGARDHPLVMQPPPGAASATMLDSPNPGVVRRIRSFLDIVSEPDVPGACLIGALDQVWSAITAGRSSVAIADRGLRVVFAGPAGAPPGALAEDYAELVERSALLVATAAGVE